VEVPVRIGFSVFMMAVGAVLTFAVKATAKGVNIHTVGVILMIAGLIGLIATLTVFAPRRRDNVVHERVVQGGPAPIAQAAPVASVAPAAVAVPAATVTQERTVESRDVY
jgi:Domain of unknown function (DUF6458)